MPKVGRLQQFPATEAEIHVVVIETSCLSRTGHHGFVAGARYMNYMQIEIEPFPLILW